MVTRSPSPPLLPLPKSAGPVLVVIWAFGYVIGTAWFLVDADGFWFMAGCLSCLIVSVPLVVGPRFDVISPWTLVLVASYIGYGIRGLFISLGINGLRSLDDLFFLGRETSYFFRPTVFFLIGLTLFTFGYLVGRARHPRRPVFGTRPDLDGRRVVVAVWVCAALGFVGFYLYARDTGGFSWTSLSAKRAVINGVNLEASYQSHGEYRVLSTFSAIAFWLQLAWYSHKRMSHGLFSARGWWLAVLLANAALLPIYASTRADLVYLVISGLLIEYCLRGTSVRLSTLVAAALVVVLASAALSSLRAVTDTTRGPTISSDVVIDTFILTRTFADIPTAGQIIHAVPDRLPYADGSTITAWLAAPIPRSVWPSKPLISSGPVLGSAIYGNQRSGVPPGMLAESYWNFGAAGVFLIPLLCGFLVRRIGDVWSPYARASPEAAILLSVAAVRPGIDLLVNSTGFAPFALVQTLALLLPVVIFVGTGTPLAKVPGQSVSADLGTELSARRAVADH